MSEINKRTSYFLLEDFQFILQQEKIQCKDLKLVQLQCLGYGLFDQAQPLNNFELFFKTVTPFLLKTEKNFTLTLTISGFDFIEQNKKKFISNLVKYISQLHQKLDGLSILTSNLQNVTIEDFVELFNLALNGNKQFKKFNLQCANWNFLEKRNPTFQQIKEIFNKFSEEGKKKRLNLTKLRLQLSAWYHKYNQGLNFLGFYDQKTQQLPVGTSMDPYDQSNFSSKIQSVFFHGFQAILRQLYKVLPDLQNFQLDLRNNHQILKLKNLKKRLDTMNIKQHLQPITAVQTSFLMNAIFMMASKKEETKKKTVTLNYIV